MKNERVLYIRSAPYEINFSNYNLQEVGLGKAFCAAGYDFDIIYYTKSKEFDQVIETANNNLRILWRKGYKILRTGFYPSVLKKDFLENYDIVITSEYGQIMTVLLSNKKEQVYNYNGPYYNLFKIPFTQRVYDVLFCKKINKRIKKMFCKTEMASRFVNQKGITNTEVVGVGLDITKFDKELQILETTNELLEKMDGHRNLLCVGSIIKRKNVALVLETFVKLKEIDVYNDVQLVIVGKGDEKYVKYCKSLIPNQYSESIIWCDFIENAQMQYIYKAATAFLLPSIYEIFGMVLLEAMYFGLPVVSSHSAGAETLICNNVNGLIIDDFDSDIWLEKIEFILNNHELARRMGESANITILSDFTWESIAMKMIKCIKDNG